MLFGESIESKGGGMTMSLLEDSIANQSYRAGVPPLYRLAISNSMDIGGIDDAMFGQRYVSRIHIRIRLDSRKTLCFEFPRG